MATTLKANVFVPEVATAVATAEFPNQLGLSLAGQPFVQGFPPEAIIGEEGDVVKFPRWNALGEFAALTEDVAMTPEAMGTSQDTAAVQVAGKAVEITDFASLAARGNPSEEAGRQFAILAARYVDSRLIVEAETTSLLQDDGAVGTATFDRFISAIFTKWGDKALQQIGGLVVHSKVLMDLFKTAEFKSADYKDIAQALMAANVAPGAPVGVIGGVPVWVSDRLTVDTAPTPDTYTNLILKRGAMGLKFQRTLLVEHDRDILKKNDVIAADVRFAVHLNYAVVSPVIKWKTQ